MTTGLGVLATLRHLLWLQGRLLRNGLLRGDVRSRGRLLLTGLLLLGSLPTLSLGTLGLYLGLKTMPADLALRVLSVALGALLLMWALAPLTGQPLTESVGYLRLLHHPVSQRSFLLGGQLSALLSLLGIVSLPLGLAAVLALAKGPLGLLAGIGTILAFLWVCLSVKSLATLVTDLLSEDRRLRHLASFLMMLAFLALYLDQVGFGNVDLNQGPGFFRAHAWSTQVARWLPSGWAAAALMRLSQGRVDLWSGATAALLLLALALLPLQNALLKRLLWGELPHAGGSGASGQSVGLREGRRLPGLSGVDSQRLRALLRKDWLLQRRSPMTLRLSVLPLIFGFMAWQLGRQPDLGAMPARLLPLLVGTLAGFTSGSLGNNRLGLVDHVGTGTLLASPTPRRLILLAHGLSQLGITGILALACGAGLALARGGLADIPAMLASAGATGALVAGLGLVSSVRFPTYVDLERGRAETNQASFAGVLLLLVGFPLLLSPMIAAALAGALMRPSWLAWLPVVGLAYGLGLFFVGLEVATRLLPRQESRLLEVLVDGR